MGYKKYRIIGNMTGNSMDAIDLVLTEFDGDKMIDICTFTRSYTKDMQNIVSFAEQIQEVNTDHVSESAFALDAYNVFRKDEVKSSFDRELLMQNAPSSNGVQFQLPPVIVD